MGSLSMASIFAGVEPAMTACATVYIFFSGCRITKMRYTTSHIVGVYRAKEPLEIIKRPDA